MRCVGACGAAGRGAGGKRPTGVARCHGVVCGRMRDTQGCVGKNARTQVCTWAEFASEASAGLVGPLFVVLPLVRFVHLLRFVWRKVFVSIKVRGVDSLRHSLDPEDAVLLWHVRVNRSEVWVPDAEGDRLCKMVLIELVPARAESLQRTNERAFLGRLKGWPWQNDNESNDTIGEPSVYGACFGCQIVDHVLPVFPDALGVI